MDTAAHGGNLNVLLRWPSCCCCCCCCCWASALLSYVVHYARSNDWICMYVPNCFTLTREGKVLIASKSRPGMVDQHDLALTVLRNVRMRTRSMLPTLLSVDAVPHATLHVLSLFPSSDEQGPCSPAVAVTAEWIVCQEQVPARRARRHRGCTVRSPHPRGAGAPPSPESGGGVDGNGVPSMHGCLRVCQLVTLHAVVVAHWIRRASAGTPAPCRHPCRRSTAQTSTAPPSRWRTWCSGASLTPLRPPTRCWT
jgi:hypothetical protein